MFVPANPSAGVYLNAGDLKAGGSRSRLAFSRCVGAQTARVISIEDVRHERDVANVLSSTLARQNRSWWWSQRFFAANWHPYFYDFQTDWS